jgi:hypothetical protein
LTTKMLLKLRGTFKVRVFEGTDWRITAPAPAPASVGEPISSSSSTATVAAAAAATSGGFVSGSKEKEKGVRFKKDDLLSDLMAPPQKPSFSAAMGPRPTQSTAALSAARGPHQQPQSAIKRSSRPLFEV